MTFFSITGACSPISRCTPRAGASEAARAITVQTGRPFTMFAGAGTFHDLASGATDRVGGAPFGSACPSVSNCETVVPRNTYFGDSLRTWDLRLGRSIYLKEGKKLDLTMDVFNLFNRPNVDEINPVYGSPVFCGGAIPKRYKEAVSAAIQLGASSAACPVSTNGLAIPGVGSFARTPITDAGPPSTSCFPKAGSPPMGPDPSCQFIPASPNPVFGQPRTMLNPRQLQFAVKFTF